MDKDSLKFRVYHLLTHHLLINFGVVYDSHLVVTLDRLMQGFSDESTSLELITVQWRRPLFF